VYWSETVTLLNVLDMVLKERQRSIELHGTWYDYTTDQMMAVITHELMMEAGEAAVIGNIHGEHGVIRELTQVASCCIKAIMVLSGRPQDLLAGASRTAGAHSGSTGFALPASLTHLEDKESGANSPEEGGYHGER
jgi:hypothetical protein